jgi:hypothetical protein
LAKKLDPKMRVFVPVIIRGEEEKGVKLWQFGKNTYLEFLSLADDEDIGDYTDIHQGRDITVDTVGPDVTGTAYNKSSVRVKTKQTPLGEPDQIQKWLEDQANPTEVFKRHSFEDMKSNLQSFLSPEEETTNEGSPSDLPFDKGGSQNNYVVKAPLKENKVDKFDELFS